MGKWVWCSKLPTASTVKQVPHIFSEEEIAMRTDTSLIVVSHEPASPPGMRRFSNAMKGVLAALAVMLVSFGASAYAAEGPYVAIGGGVNILNDADVTAQYANPLFTPLDAKSSTDTGYKVKGALGWAFANGFRVEGEISYRKHNLNEINVRSPGAFVLDAYNLQVARPRGLPEGRDAYLALAEADPATKQALERGTVQGSPHPLTGDFQALTFKANAFYDIDLGFAWKPYVGGGIGFTKVSVDVSSGRTGNLLVDDSDTVFSYQVGAGVGYEFPLPEGRSITLSLDYRYFDAGTPTFTGYDSNLDFDASISGNYVGVGLRYGF